jgi:septum formation protein
VPAGTIVIGADTVVALKSRIYFKPEGEADAIRMLHELSGQTHQVLTGVAVREVGKATQLDAVSTDVHIKTLTEEDILKYVATGEPLDKAGAYGIQGVGGSLVDRIDGDYFNVVGLPIDRLIQMLSVHVDIMPFRTARRGLTPEIFRQHNL